MVAKTIIAAVSELTSTGRSVYDLRAAIRSQQCQRVVLFEIGIVVHSLAAPARAVLGFNVRMKRRGQLARILHIAKVVLRLIVQSGLA